MAIEPQFQIGEIRVRPDRHELEGPGGVTRLEPKSMSVLKQLIGREGEVCSRRQLLDTVWKGQFVGEEVLTRCIWELRQALGDDARNPKFIQTVPKVGYRLLGPVETLGECRPGRSEERGGPRPSVELTAGADLRHRRQRRDLLILAGKVERFWIRSVLEAALPSEPLELRLRERAQQVAGVWEEFAEEAEPSGARLPVERPLPELFEASGRALLLLGEPGAGKTTTLLRLVAAFLERARRDPSEPVPVVFQLSSWSTEDGDLAAWLVAELNRRYQIPTAIGRDWLEGGELMLFLDGLDEMARARRASWMRACNEFRRGAGLVGIVVACRSAEYDEAARAAEPLDLGGAVALEPLNRSQVLQYLARIEGDQQGLRSALQEDLELQRLVESPLMLSVMGRAFGSEAPLEDGGRQEDPQAAPKDRRRRVWSNYVDRMLTRPGRQLPCSLATARDRLVWLAQSLRREDEAVFELSRLQPSWLAGRWDLAVYLLLSRCGAGLYLGLTHMGIAWWLGFDRHLALVVAAGPIAGLAVALLDGIRARHPLVGRRLLLALYPLIVWLVSGLVAVAVMAPNSSLLGAIRAFFILGLSFSLLFGTQAGRRPIARDVGYAEVVRWSWRKAVRGGVVTAGAVLSGHGILWAFLWATRNSNQPSAQFGLEPGIVFGMIGAVLFGLRGRRVEKGNRHGLRLHLRNAAIGGSLVTVSLWLALSLSQLVPWMIVGPDPASLEEKRKGLPLIAGVTGFLWFGGLDAIKHLSLRALLGWRGLLPWRARRFLDFTVARALLRAVGSGYRELLDYLADEPQRYR